MDGHTGEPWKYGESDPRWVKGALHKKYGNVFFCTDKTPGTRKLSGPREKSYLA